MSNGWDQSAAAWIAEQGEEGDFGRRFVLDAPMVARISGQGFKNALDIGCGEGRFCRVMRANGIHAVGIDPTAALLDAARARDPEGDYREGRAEALNFASGSFDLVVSYLTLIDIDDVDRAIPEMARVLRPGGALLIANIASYATATTGWLPDGGNVARFSLDHYLEERAMLSEWAGLSIRNWHRPLSRYMTLLLDAGLELRHFAEPAARPGGDPARSERYCRVPWFNLMEWSKPDRASPLRTRTCRMSDG